MIQSRNWHLYVETIGIVEWINGKTDTVEDTDTVGMQGKLVTAVKRRMPTFLYNDHLPMLFTV